MLKFFDGQTDGRTDGRTDRVITIGHPPSGGALIITSLYCLMLQEPFTQPRIKRMLLGFTSHKGLPGCFFTHTSLLKSLNNLEPICNNVNINSS